MDEEEEEEEQGGGGGGGCPHCLMQYLLTLKLENGNSLTCP